MRKRNLFVTVLFMLLITAQVFAFMPTAEQLLQKSINYNKVNRINKTLRPQDIKVLASFSKRIKGNWAMNWDYDKNVPASLYGILTEPTSKSPEAVALQFFQDNANLYQAEKADNMRVEKTVKSGTYSHITMAQVVSGFKVEGSEVRVHLNSDNQIVKVNGAYNAAESITNRMKLTRAEAVAIAKKDAKVEKIRANSIIKRVAVPSNFALNLAYKIVVLSEKPFADFVYLIDAETGNIIEKRNDMITITAKGSVYDTNPVHGKPESKSLLHVTKSGYLYGKYCSAVNEDFEEAYNKDNLHNYGLKDTRFDEANVYYHVNVIHDYFAKMGFKGLDRPMPATVHVKENYDNAYYSPWQGGIFFGDGNRLNSLSREAGIIYHEYTHAVTGNIVNMVYKAESGAINEACSDYFACTITDDPKIGEWAMKKMNRPYLRHLVNNLMYPEDIENEVHADSRIYGAALWSLRKALGKKVADKIIHKHRYFLGRTSTFKDGLAGLIEADKDLNGGKNANTIKKLFAKKGIGGYGNLNSKEVEETVNFSDIHNK